MKNIEKIEKTEKSEYEVKKETKNDMAEIVFILDRSASMSGLEEETIKGFNSLIRKQKKEKGNARITTVLFDDRYEMLCERENINKVKKLTDREYYVRGATALLDAVGKTIETTGKILDRLSEKEKPDHVLFVVTTDGMENSSREYTLKTVSEMVRMRRKKCGWEFLFLGANIDAPQTAEKMGMDRKMASDYKADRKGTKMNFEMISEAASSLRNFGEIKEGWNKDMDEYLEETKNQTGR